MDFPAFDGALVAREGYTSLVARDGIISTRPSVSSPLCPSPSPSPSPPFTRNPPDPDSDSPDQDPFRAPTTSSASASSASSTTASSSTLPAVLDLTPHGRGAPRPRPSKTRADIPRIITVVLKAKIGIGNDMNAGGTNELDELRQHHRRANPTEKGEKPREFDHYLPPNVIPCSFDVEDDDSSGMSNDIDDHDDGDCRYRHSSHAGEGLEEEDDEEGGDIDGEEEEGPHLLLRASFACYSTEGEVDGIDDLQAEEGSEDAVVPQSDLACLDEFLPPLLSPPPSPPSPRFGQLPPPSPNKLRKETLVSQIQQQQSASSGSKSSSSSSQVPPHSIHPALSSAPASEKLRSESRSEGEDVDSDDYIFFPPGTMAATSYQKNRHTASTLQSFSSSGSSNSNRISQPSRNIEDENSDDLLALFSRRRLVERLQFRSNSKDGNDTSNLGHGHDQHVMKEDPSCEDNDDEEGDEKGPHLLYCDSSACCSCDSEGEGEGNTGAYSGRQATGIGGEKTNRTRHGGDGLIIQRRAARTSPRLDAISQGVDLYEHVQPCKPTSDQYSAQKKSKPVAAGIRSVPARFFGTMTGGRDRRRRGRATTPPPATAAKEMTMASSSLTTEKNDTCRRTPKLPPPLSRRGLVQKKSINSEKRGAIKSTTRQHEERNCQPDDNDSANDFSYAYI